MAEFKLVISDPKTGKSYQREVKEQNAGFFLGKKIGDKFKGEAIDLTGYEFEITGGSDYCGFPMRKDVKGVGRKRILAIEGVGIHKLRKKTKKGKRKFTGVRQRKTVCGNTIHDKTAQINVKILVQGKTPLVAEEKKEEKAKKEEKVEKKPEEKPKEEKKEAAKEEKKEEPKKEKPKEEPKKKEKK